MSDGAINSLANVTNNVAGKVIFGTDSSFTLLVLSGNVLVTNTTPSRAPA